MAVATLASVAHRGVVSPMPPALRHLASLAALDRGAQDALRDATARRHGSPARREMVREGSEVAEARLITAGWAAEVRILSDGRRQLLGFLLPGDVFGWSHHESPLAPAAVVAITEVETCAAPRRPVLEPAYAAGAALREAYLLDQVARLGRMTALERVYSLFLELNERLERSGLAQAGRFPMPLTQEMLADALGLTSVHVNRMLQEARRAGEFELTRGVTRLRDPDGLAQRMGRAPTRIAG